MLKELRPPKSLKYTTEQTLSLVFVEAYENIFKTLFKNVMKALVMYGLKTQVCPDFRNGTCIIYVDVPETEKNLIWTIKLQSPCSLQSSNNCHLHNHQALLL